MKRNNRAKKWLRSSATKIEKEIKNLPSKRKRKAPDGVDFSAEIKKSPAREIDQNYWHRYTDGEFFVIGHDLDDLDKKQNQFDQEESDFLKILQDSEEFCDKPREFDHSPRKKTPTKAITQTPRRREFKNILKTIIEKYDHSQQLMKKIRLLFFQEIKNGEARKLTLQKIKNDPKSQEKLKKLQKRLAPFLSADGSQIVVKGKKNKAQITLARKKPKSRYVKGHISAKNIEKNCFEEELGQPLELSHLIPVSQGGPKECALPTARGHNSKRIPIEILSLYFIKFGLSLEFETVDTLIRKNQLEFIPFPNSEKVIYNIPQIGIKLTFFLDTLCPEEPVRELHLFTRALGLYSLSGTSFFKEAEQNFKKKQAKKPAIEHEQKSLTRFC